MPVASAPYRYSPLPSNRHIRLLRITHHGEQNLHVSLKSFLLDAAPDFEALSYTWGSAIYE
jgi:hypothetical protein